jgi:hypothetical protein
LLSPAIDLHPAVSAYGLNGEIEQASAELAEARKLSSDEQLKELLAFSAASLGERT